MKDLRKPNAPFVAMATDMDYTYAPIEVIGDKIYMFRTTMRRNIAS